MNREYSRKIAAAVREGLKGMDRHFSFDEENGVFSLQQSIPGPLSEVREIVEVREDDYVVYAYSPIRPDPDNRKVMREVAAFLTETNSGLREGNFEFDFRDGEVRYRDFVDCEGALPPQEVIEGSIHCPAAMFVRYGGGIPQIVYAGRSAEQALEQCEKGESDLRRRIEQLRKLLAMRESSDAEDADADGADADDTDDETGGSGEDAADEE